MTAAIILHEKQNNLYFCSKVRHVQNLLGQIQGDFLGFEQLLLHSKHICVNVWENIPLRSRNCSFVI